MNKVCDAASFLSLVELVFSGRRKCRLLTGSTGRSSGRCTQGGGQASGTFPGSINKAEVSEGQVNARLKKGLAEGEDSVLLPAAARHRLVNWSVLERGRPRVERKVVELPRTHGAEAHPRTGARPAQRYGHSSHGSAQPRRVQ